MTKTWNFGAGPAVMPKSVLIKAQKELVDYKNTGMSVMELSHRSKEFDDIINTAEANLRKLLNIPMNYKILFLQGGATTQFSSIFLNLVGDDITRPCDYMVSGGWSDKAAAEAKKLGANVNYVFNTKSEGFTRIPPKSEWKLSPNASYLYFCDNETVHGVEFQEVPKVNCPVVCDMSSNILSRPFDVTKFDLIMAGAQKNIGPAGLTIVIIKENLIGTRLNPKVPCPILLNYKTHAANRSLYNTPPTFGIYMAGLVFEWLLSIGGVEAISAINTRKAQRLYSTINKYSNTYKAVVAEDCRSRMNVPFRIIDASGKPSKELEAEFLKGAIARHMVQLKGHRSVGGIRASIYNAMPEEGVEVLCKYMEEFARQKAKL